MSGIKKGFTLIEMLIVIVIIGILSASLLPRVMGIQARARDTAREVDMRNMALAIELYALDHGNYPGTGEPDFATELGYHEPLLFAERIIPTDDTMVSTDTPNTVMDSLNISTKTSTSSINRAGGDAECTGRICGSIRGDDNRGTIGSESFQTALKGYINTIPMDKGNGLSSRGKVLQRNRDNAENLEMLGNNEEQGGLKINRAGDDEAGLTNLMGCIQQGDYFAYSTDGKTFAITSLKESKQGNSDNCYGDVPNLDSEEMGRYHSVVYVNGKETSLLQQATAGLEQANQLPQGVLKLPQGDENLEEAEARIRDTDMSNQLP